MPKTFFYQASSTSQLLPFPTLFYGQSSTAVWLGQRQFWYVGSAPASNVLAPALDKYGDSLEPERFLLAKKRFDDYPVVNNIQLLSAGILASGMQEPERFLLATRRFDGLLQDVFLPAAIVPFVPPPVPSVTCTGTSEAGTCSFVNLAAGGFEVIIGPLLSEFRDEFSMVVKASASDTFNLSYQFTTDGGTTWWPAKPQVNSQVVTADGGGYTNSAIMFAEMGFQDRIVLYNTSGGTINGSYEWRYSFESIRKWMLRR